MNFIQLAYFRKVMECGSVTQAARQLCITQPAVSKQLRLLEQSVIHEKIAGFIFSVPIEGRMEPGGTLGKKDSCFFCITGVFCGLFR